MPELYEHTTIDKKVQVTADYCYQKAAENLSPCTSMMSGASIEFAREWRLLGDSLVVRFDDSPISLDP